MRYSVVIRTLGNAGGKYLETINSIRNQTIKPEKVVVYIAEGYPLPPEHTTYEKYVYVKKGMVRQRALYYEEVETEYVLFLDDDVFLPNDAVEKLYCYLQANDADIIAPEVFVNASRDWVTRLRMAVLGKSYARLKDDKWGYKALRNGGYSYNPGPSQPVYFSQLNSGPCFFCRKRTFLAIHFEEEIWLDNCPYALPEDQVMFYKFYKYGYKMLTYYDSGIVHLDAGSSIKDNRNKELKIIYSESRNKIIYWHRFFYLPDRKSTMIRIINVICISHTYLIRLLVLLGKLKFKECSFWLQGITEAIKYLHSIEYKELPHIPSIKNENYTNSIRI